MLFGSLQRLLHGREIALIVGALVWIMLQLIFLIFRNTRKKFLFPCRKNILYSAFFFYCVAVVAVTQFPLILADSDPYGWLSELRINLVPFRTIIQDLQPEYAPFGLFYAGRWSVVGNVILTIPLGVFLSLTKERRFRNVVLIGILFSAGIEILQLSIGLITGVHWRTTNIDDVILNTTGTIIGYGLCLLAPKKLKQYFIFNEIKCKESPI